MYLDAISTKSDFYLDLKRFQHITIQTNQDNSCDSSKGYFQGLIMVWNENEIKQHNTNLRFLFRVVVVPT